ncbi:MAG TPA: DinB family protein [Pyrinomonadaceae bacterium]|nr:DinB family protein [Pyrinomonadaceae bacterium]
MTEIERIQDQLKRAFEGNAWHGPAVLELLNNVNASHAAAHPIRGAHSVWEIVLHIAAWENAGRRRLEGDRAQLPDEEDWAPVLDQSEQAWQKTCEMLVENHRQLVQAIARVNDSRLDEPVLEGLASVYVTLQGVVQHDLYHAGQIAILKKALVEREAK